MGDRDVCPHCIERAYIKYRLFPTKYIYINQIADLRNKIYLSIQCLGNSNNSLKYQTNIIKLI